jgi:hypothetical protein
VLARQVDAAQRFDSRDAALNYQVQKPPRDAHRRFDRQLQTKNKSNNKHWLQIKGDEKGVVFPEINLPPFEYKQQGL